MDESLGPPRCSEAMVDRYNNKGYDRRAQGHAWVGDADRMNAPTSKPLACSFSIMFWICLNNPFKQKFPLTISGMASVERISSPWGRHRTVSPCLPSHPQCWVKAGDKLDLCKSRLQLEQVFARTTSAGSWCRLWWLLWIQAEHDGRVEKGHWTVSQLRWSGPKSGRSD